MDTFDRFKVTLDSAALMKTSAPKGEEKYPLDKRPDGEFGLVVMSRGRKARAFPMTTPGELAASVALCEEMAAEDMLPGRLAKVAADRLSARAREFGLDVPDAEGAPGEVYWQDNIEGYGWTLREARHAEKVSSDRRSEALSHPVHPALATFSVAGRDVCIRTRADVEAAGALLARQGEKLSSAECRSVARAVVDAMVLLTGEVDCDDFVSKFSEDVRAFIGTRPRPEAGEILRARAESMRTGRGDLLFSGTRSKVSEAYRGLADAAEKLSSREDLLALVDAIEKLDKLSGYKGQHAHRVVFLAAGEENFIKASAEGPSDEGIYYSYGSTTLRKEDIEALSRVDLRALEPLLGEEGVDRLRQDPLKVFDEADSHMRRQLARFVEEFIKLRQAHRSTY